MIDLDIKEPMGIKARWVPEFGLYSIMGWDTGGEGDKAINKWNSRHPVD